MIWALVILGAVYLGGLWLKGRKARKEREAQQARVARSLTAINRESLAALWEREAQRERELESYR